MLEKGKAVKVASGKETGRGNTKVLSTSDKTFIEPEIPHNTQKAVAKQAGVSTGKIAMSEIVMRKDPAAWAAAQAVAAYDAPMSKAQAGTQGGRGNEKLASTDACFNPPSNQPDGSEKPRNAHNCRKTARITAECLASTDAKQNPASNVESGGMPEGKE